MTELISCDNCGVILDLSKLVFVDSITKDNIVRGVLNRSVQLVRFCECPVCKTCIVE